MKPYEQSQGYADPLEIFKRELEARCERSFQDLRKKNDITKTLINNLSDGIDRQQQRVELLGSNIRNLQGSVQQDTSNIIDATNHQQVQLQREVASVIGEKDRQISEVVQQIIARLQGFEETIKGIPKPDRPNQQRANNLQASLAELDNQIQILSQRNGPQQINYEVEREHLYRDMNFLEQILEEEKNEFNETNKLLEKNLEVYKATIEQPINNFDVNLSRQNQENQKILKSKLHSFASRIKKLQANLQKIAQDMKQRRKAIAEGQRKLEEGIASLGQGIMQANQNLAGLDKERMQKIQDNGNFLDSFVDNMLLQTAELNKRIDNLKAAYETEINKLKSDFNSRSQEVEMVRKKN